MSDEHSHLVHLQCPQCLEVLRHQCSSVAAPNEEPQGGEWELEPSVVERFARTQERMEERKRARQSDSKK